jgi:hypothetical protein
VKADEDDNLTEVLEKYASTHSDAKVLSKENATEAAVELMEQRKKCDTLDSMDHVKTVFGEVWKDHDISGKGFINYNEGFSMMEDLFVKMQ